MITLKLKLDLDGLPHQWATQPITKHTTLMSDLHNPAGKHTTQKSNKTTTGSSQPTAPTNTSASGKTIPQWPHIFANNETIKLLQVKKGRVLTEIFSEAGIGGGGGDKLNLTGLPDDLCLRYLILGRCSGGKKNHECNRAHPTTSVSTKAAEAVFRQIEPGLKCIADKQLKQRTE